MTIIEAIATVFGILCGGLMVRRIIWCWPAGIIQVALYVYIFYEAQLYSDMILHVIYIFLNAYGWYHWLHGGEAQKALTVTMLGQKFWGWVLLAVGGTALWGFTMGKLTDASVPYADAFTTVVSLVAQWLMVRKKVESWILWIVVDIAAIAIYWYKGLYITTGLYAVFLVLAVLGYADWRKNYKLAMA